MTKIGATYNAYEVLKEMDTFLKELRLSGYKVKDMRRDKNLHGSILEVRAVRRGGLFVTLGSKNGIPFHHAFINPIKGEAKMIPFMSTERLEEIIMEFIHEHG